MLGEVSRRAQRRFRLTRAGAVACAMLLGHGLPAAAQPQAPVAQPPTREQLQPRQPVPQAPTPSRLEVVDEIERSPCALDRPGARDIRFTPTRILFDNLRGLPAEALREAYQPFLGQEQPITVICEIRDRAATILRDAGYLAAIEVPPQQVAGGEVRFDVLMAKLVGVRVRGTGGRAERLIASYLQNLVGRDPFNRFEAERYVLLVNDLPGFVIRLSLRSADAARGDVIGEVTLLRTPVYLDANVQNLGSEALGPWGAAVQGQLNDLTGLGDRTTLTAFTTLDADEQQSVQAGHDFMLGSEGLQLGGQLTYGVARPDLGDPNLRVKSNSLIATAQASFPFVRSQLRNIRGTIGFDYVDQDMFFNGAELSRDHLRVGFARVVGELVAPFEGRTGYSLQEPRWRVVASLEGRQGFDVFGSSQSCVDFLACLLRGDVPPSRLDGDATATVLRGSVYSEFRPQPRLTLALGGRVQHSHSSLLTFEEFAIGNFTVGRGYEPGILLGDRGASVQAEARYGSTLQPGSNRLAAEAFVFVDQAWIRNAPLFGAPPERQSLTSIGAGLRVAFRNTTRLEAVLAAPLVAVPLLGEVPDPRFLLTFSTSLLPWSF